MNAALRIGYGAAGQLARILAAIAPPGRSKLIRSLRGRRGIRQRLSQWGATGREPGRQLLWMHAPSVGEGLQARPVLELARQRRPDLQIAYTYFSPSAVAFAARLGVDFSDFLPFDTVGDDDAALLALRPKALVFSKLDVWPLLAERAARRGVRLGLISATLAAASSRRGRLSARALSAAYSLLDAVGAIDERDAERLVALGVRGDRIEVTGDTRYDQVWARALDVRRDAGPVAELAADRPTLVAGSTWPADEIALLAAWLELRRRWPGARMIVAPHEPTPAHLEPIERWCRDSDIPFARLGSPAAAAAEVVIVDRVGVLGDLYALADVAFVGGAFHAAGLHSVLEPAAFGVPVLFGPRHSASRDAALLIGHGGGRSAATAAELADTMALWLGESSERAESGRCARAMVERGLGAAERSWRLVERLLSD